MNKEEARYGKDWTKPLFLGTILTRNTKKRRLVVSDFPMLHLPSNSVKNEASSPTYPLRPLHFVKTITGDNLASLKQTIMDSPFLSASEIAGKLNLQPHQEGGFYTETFRDDSVQLQKSQLPSQYKVERPVSSCIYFLLPAGSVSRLHRIPCAETWHHYIGEPLTVVELNEKDESVKFTCLGSNLNDNQRPQYTVPPNVWFGSFPTNDFNISPDGSLSRTPPRDSESHYSLVGCTCAPAFHFLDFELAKRSDLISLFPHLESLISALTNPE